MPTQPQLPLNAENVADGICGEVIEFLQKFPCGNVKNWRDLVAKLERWVEGIDPTIASAGALRVLETSDRYQCQLVAGHLLRGRKIDEMLTLDALLRRVLPRWNESAWTVPAFLADAFGKGALIAAAENLVGESDDPALGGKAATVLYWLRNPNLLDRKDF